MVILVVTLPFMEISRRYIMLVISFDNTDHILGVVLAIIVGFSLVFTALHPLTRISEIEKFLKSSSLFSCLVSFQEIVFLISAIYIPFIILCIAGIFISLLENDKDMAILLLIVSFSMSYTAISLGPEQIKDKNRHLFQ